MNFRKTEEQELLLESLRELIKRECPESYFAECNRKHEYPEAFMKALLDGGFSLLGIPEAYGGTEVDILTLMMVGEELGRLGAPVYLFDNALQVKDMLDFGSEDQKKQALDLVLQGKRPFCLGITEPQAGSDDSAITATATRKDGKVYINGHKTFISFATDAPYMLCLTRDLDAPNPHKAMSMWWIPMNSPGIKVEPLHKIGLFCANTCEVYLENVEIEEKDLVGTEGKGFIQLMKNFEVERLMISAGILGSAWGAYEDALAYANERVQFGKTIGSFQLIQEKLVNMAIKIENMRHMVYKTAWEIDNLIPVNITSSLTKLYVARSAFEVIDDAMQILGGIGYTEDHRISRFWRDVRLYRIAGGTDEIMIYIAGRALLKQNAKK